jgi:phosphomannomutase
MAGIFKAYDIRGTYPDQLDETTAFRVGYHYRDLMEAEDLERGPKVVVTHDMRSHSKPLHEAVIHGLRVAGVAVVDAGLADTPMNYFAVGHLAASGGIQVTASHNPAAYNGLKLCRRDAIPVSSETGIDQLERLVSRSSMASPVSPDLAANADLERVDLFAAYTEHILAHQRSSAPRLKVAADAANGMATIYRPILDALNVELVPLYFTLDGTFPNHEANPLKPENLVDLQAATVEHGCDLGVAFDGDADRAMFVDENGKVVTADIITALLAPVHLADNPGSAIVYDLRSSRATREAIEQAGGQAIRERVGHSFMKATMRRLDAPFGGELAGHFYYRSSYTADSSILTVVQVLDLLRSRRERLSRLVQPLQRYHATGEINFVVEDTDAMIARLADEFADGQIDYVDGITVQYDDWWFNVRPSNTEPLLRLVLEASSAELMEAKKELMLTTLGTPE